MRGGLFSDFFSFDKATFAHGELFYRLLPLVDVQVSALRSHWSDKLPGGLSAEDLWVAGAIALHKTLPSYKPALNDNVSGWASVVIHRALIEELRSNFSMPKELCARLQSFEDERWVLSEVHGREVKLEEVVDRHGCDPLTRWKLLGGVYHPLSYDAITTPDSGQFRKECPDSETPTPLEELSRSEFAELVREAVEQLPAPLSQVVYWRYWAELSVQDIARRVGRGETAVYMRLGTAKTMLRRSLGSLVT
ncbi:MAG: sigma-70 family RNA polymerase sigma factor [Patescibacteria group bacterium]